MPQKYFKCDNTDCDCKVEEPDCVCFKWTAEMKVETCSYTQKTRMAATGKHLKSCYEATKTGFSLGTKKVIDKVKRQHSGAPNFGASNVRDALLDEGFSKADLPPVKQIQIYLNSKKKSSSSCHNIEGFQNQLSKMRRMHARERYDIFVFVMYAREFTVEFHFSRMLVMKE